MTSDEVNAVLVECGVEPLPADGVGRNAYSALVELARDNAFLRLRLREFTEITEMVIDTIEKAVESARTGHKQP